MPTETSIEQRLTAVEQAVSALQQRLAQLPVATNWVARITGSFKDEPAFEDFSRVLGQMNESLKAMCEDIAKEVGARADGLSRRARLDPGTC